MKTDPNKFPPQLKAVNELWNSFIRDHYDFIFEYSAKRKTILNDYDNGAGIITKETQDERLKELFEDNLPYSRQFAEIWLSVKHAEALFAPHANAMVRDDIPYWAPIIDDTLPGNPGYSKTVAKVFYEGSIKGGAGADRNSDSAL